jgi:guanylate kinase
MEERLRSAETELRAQSEFAHVIVNDEIERATEQLTTIVRESLSAGEGATGR